LFAVNKKSGVGLALLVEDSENGGCWKMLLLFSK